MGSRIAVTGIGMVSSIGHTRAEVSSALRELRHGFEPVAWPEFPEATVKVAGTVKGYLATSPFTHSWKAPAGVGPFPVEVLRTLPPHGFYALGALTAALAEAGFSPDTFGGETAGLYAASAGSPQVQRNAMSAMERSKGARGEPLALVRSIAGTLNFTLASWLKIQGPGCGFVSACASSAHALGYACDDLRLGRAERALIIGAEDLSPENVLPFAAMRALSLNPDPATASRPFDRQRNGFVATGGAAALVIETEAAARARGATIRAWLDGWGQASDGHHVSAPDPTGAGLQRAMRAALRDTGRAARELGYINAHATSTPVGDKAEAMALRAVLDGALVPISSTKALTGHGLSLAGALEAAFCVLCLEEGIIPGCAQLTEPDEACAGLNLPRTTLAENPQVAMSNSSGFGGANVSLIFSAA